MQWEVYWSAAETSLNVSDVFNEICHTQRSTFRRGRINCNQLPGLLVHEETWNPPVLNWDVIPLIIVKSTTGRRTVPWRGEVHLFYLHFCDCPPFVLLQSVAENWRTLKFCIHKSCSHSVLAVSSSVYFKLCIYLSVIVNIIIII